MLNIADFSNISDYLYILNGVIITDLIVILLLLTKFIDSKVLEQWYRKYNLHAVLADVLIIVIGIIIARFLYFKIFNKYSLVTFLLLVVCIQVIHDILFYGFSVSVPRGVSAILDVFKDYGKESGIKAIIADSLMMISSVLLATYLKSMSYNANIIIFIVVIYLSPYFVYSI